MPFVFAWIKVGTDFQGALAMILGILARVRAVRAVLLLSLIRKKATVDWSCSAWEESSSAVEAISSVAEAFCWIT